MYPYDFSQLGQQMQGPVAQQPSYGPTIDNAAMLGQGPTMQAAQASGSSGMNPDYKPSKKEKSGKDGGMWDAMLTALTAGIGAYQRPPIGTIPYGASVGSLKTNSLGAPSSAPGDFKSILAQYLRG